MNFIKKIADKNFDDLVHLQFTRFSKGSFKLKAVIKAKHSAKKYTINTSAEFANELVRAVANELGENKTKVVGAIVSTSDLKEKIKFKEIKQFQGVKRYLIDQEMSGNDLIKLLDEFPKTFCGLTFESDKSKLKIKPKAPKAPKAGKGEEIPKPDFCKLVTTNEELGKSFVFEKPGFKNAMIAHDIEITELILPKDEKDFSKIRELAKRKGKIIRKAEIDEEKTEKSYEFEA